MAKLKFSPFRARWVAKEIWHPDQKGETLEDGSYVLTIPYSDERELIMDILRQNTDVEVLSPSSLRNAVKAKLAETLKIYGGT